MPQQTYLEDEEELDAEKLTSDLAPLTTGGGFETPDAVPETTTPAPAAPAPAPTPAVAAPIPVAATGGTPMANPPPPPPPPAPAAFDFDSADPSSYLSEFVKQTRAAGDQRRTLARGDAGRGIDEWAAQRGLVGSSYEGDQRADLERRLSADLAGEERDLLDTVIGREMESRKLAQTDRELDLRETRDIGELDIARSEVQQQESQFAREFGLDEKKFTADSDQFAKTFSEQVATRLQQDAQWRTTLTSEEARDSLDRGLREKALQLQRDGMTMDEAYRQAALDQEKELTEGAQALTRLGITTENAYRYAALDQVADQFAKTFSEQVATRLQQDAQWRTTLTSEEARDSLDRGLREKALQLQRDGMTMDEAYRRAALDQEKELTTRAQELTEAGIMGGQYQTDPTTGKRVWVQTAENAYRYAALEQDKTFRQRALDLQRDTMEQDAGFRKRALDLQAAGQTADQAYRTAELEFRRTGQGLDEAYRTAELEYRKRSTDRTTLVQLIQALGSMGGISSNAAATVQKILAGMGIQYTPRSSENKEPPSEDEPPPPTDSDGIVRREETDDERRQRLARGAE